MEKKVISDLHVKVNENNTSYDITYYDIENYTFTKGISKTVEYPEVKGFGHFVTETLWSSPEGNIYFSTIPHNEIKSSEVGVTHSLAEMSDEEHRRCSMLTTEIYYLLKDGKVKQSARDEKEEHDARIVFDDICTTYYLEKAPLIHELSKSL